jgi:hypothetical protein
MVNNFVQDLFFGLLYGHLSFIIKVYGFEDWPDLTLIIIFKFFLFHHLILDYWVFCFLFIYFMRLFSYNHLNFFIKKIDLTMHRPKKI